MPPLPPGFERARLDYECAADDENGAASPESAYCACGIASADNQDREG
jgi:hypothetical protein